MKLLFIIHNVSSCGAERVLALVANELVLRGHDVYVLTDKQHVDYPLDSRIKVLDVFEYQPRYNASGLVGKVVRNIRYNIGFRRTLKKDIRAIQPDHIVSFLGYLIWQLLPYRKRYRITISDHSAMDRNLGRVRNYERHVLPKRFVQQTVLTQADKDFLAPTRTNVVVMHNPLTFPPISTEEFDSLLTQRKNILFCGSVDRYKVKGLDNMLRAFAKVAKQHPDWNLDIAGGGTEQNTAIILQLAEQLGIADRVRMLGFRTDVQELMKSHALLVLSSRTEGFGMVLTEAMACGCPVVSYALSGPCEIITDGKDGLLAENQNVNNLAEVMSKLMINPELREQLSRNALQSVNRFSLSSIVDRWEEILK